jgi:oxygen-independent coproporphyrinogen-3 oxidase
VADGLLELDPDELRVTELGRIFLRNIAMPFDEYLDPHADGQRFSRTV